MKFTIDTKAKTIIIEEVVIIDDMLKELEELNIDYKEYKLFPHIESYSYPVYPNYDSSKDPNIITVRNVPFNTCTNT